MDAARTTTGGGLSDDGVPMPGTVVVTPGPGPTRTVSNGSSQIIGTSGEACKPVAASPPVVPAVRTFGGPQFVAPFSVQLR